MHYITVDLLAENSKTKAAFCIKTEHLLFACARVDQYESC